MKNFYHIKSLVPAQISINGECNFISNLDIISNRNFYIAFFPTNSQKYSPCATSAHEQANNHSIKKIPFKDNHIDIIFNPQHIKCLTKENIILNKKYMNTIFTISNTTETFINITSTKKTYSSSTELIRSIEFKTFGHIVIIIGSISKEKNYILIYNTSNQKIILEKIIHKIEHTKTSIKLLKEELSYTGYAKVYEFNTTTKNISEYNVVVREPQSPHSSEIVPLFFLECLKFKDYKNAKKYLSNSCVENNHLINFFGNIQEIYYNGYSKDINYTILNDKGFKSFTFNIEENKIIEIEENNLNTY